MSRVMGIYCGTQSITAIWEEDDVPYVTPVLCLGLA